MAAPTYQSADGVEYFYAPGNLVLGAGATFAFHVGHDTPAAEASTAGTLAGAAMTKHTTLGEAYHWWYYQSKNSPTTGTVSVGVGNPDSYYNGYLWGLSGVNTGAPIYDYVAGSSEGGTSISISVPSTVDTLICAVFILYGDMTGLAAQSGGTIRTQFAGDRTHVMVTKAGAAGSTTIGVQWTNSNAATHYVSALAANGTSGATGLLSPGAMNVAVTSTAALTVTSASANAITGRAYFDEIMCVQEAKVSTGLTRDAEIGDLTTQRVVNATNVGHWAEVFESGAVANWNVLVTESGALTYVAGVGVMGGGVMQVTGKVWREYPRNIPYDPSKLYRLRARVRRTAAGGVAGRMYLGVNGIAADGTTRVNYTGANSAGSQHYICNQNVDQSTLTLNEWYVYTGYFKGHAATGSLVPSTNPALPSVLHENVRYFRPMLLFNYPPSSSDGSDTMQIDGFSLDVYDEVTGSMGSGQFGQFGPLPEDSYGSPMMRLYQAGTCTDGQAVDFTTEGMKDYPTTPTIRLSGGLLYNSTNGNWSGGTAPALQYEYFAVESPSTTGFTARAKLRSVTTPTARTAQFAGTTLDVLNETDSVTVASNLPAVGQITVRGRYSVSITPKYSGQAASTSIEIAVETSYDGSVWSERGRALFQATGDDGGVAVTESGYHNFVFADTGLSNGDMIRLKVVGGSVSGAYTNATATFIGSAGTGGHGDGISWYSGTITEASKTPNAGDRIIWEAWY